MLFKTCTACQEQFDYTRDEDGLWTAEFRGVFRVRVTDASLEKCRYRAIEELDKQLAGWIVAPATSPDVLARCVLKPNRRMTSAKVRKHGITKSR